MLGELDIPERGMKKALDFLERVVVVLEEAYMNPVEEGIYNMTIPDYMMSYGPQALGFLQKMETVKFERRRAELEERFRYMGDVFDFTAKNYSQNNPEHDPDDPNHCIINHDEQAFYVWHPHNYLIAQMEGNLAEPTIDWRDRIMGPIRNFHTTAPNFELEYKKPTREGSKADVLFIINYNENRDGFGNALVFAFERGIFRQAAYFDLPDVMLEKPHHVRKNLEPNLRFLGSELGIPERLLHQFLTHSNLTEASRNDLKELIEKTSGE
jgi:hypothetical protein